VKRVLEYNTKRRRRKI